MVVMGALFIGHTSLGSNAHGLNLQVYIYIYIYICYEFIEFLVGSRPAKVKVYAAQSKASHTEKGHDFCFGKATNYSSKKESHR